MRNSEQVRDHPKKRLNRKLREKHGQGSGKFRNFVGYAGISMRDSQKIKRIHLPVNDQDIPLLLGIVSADSDYRLTLKLNSKLGISLKSTDPVESEDKGVILQFSRFSDPPGTQDFRLQLVSNRSGKNHLLKKLKNVDYLLLLQKQFSENNQEEIISRIRDIDSVTGVFAIELKSFRDRSLKYLI
jgi:hypothetical protein